MYHRYSHSASGSTSYSQSPSYSDCSNPRQRTSLSEPGATAPAASVWQDCPEIHHSVDGSRGCGAERDSRSPLSKGLPTRTGENPRHCEHAGDQRVSDSTEIRFGENAGFKAQEMPRLREVRVRSQPTVKISQLTRFQAPRQGVPILFPLR